MKITKLILNKYKRFLLNNIKSFVLTPNIIYQIIIGTNGSGKSSLLKELSPLPGNPKDFAEGGLKHIEIEDSGSKYVLISDFKKGNKHQFIKNGENLNPGGTITVQKELVEKEFGYYTELHELLTGEVNFTSLSPTKRREWITKLSDVDFSYALGVFQKLKTSVRDTQGALKHVKQRSVLETNKLKSIEDLDKIQLEYEVLLSEIDFLFKEIDNSAKDYTTEKEKLVKLLEYLRTQSVDSIKAFPYMPPGYNFDSLESVVSELDSIKTQKEVNRSLIARMGEELDELSFILGNIDGEEIDPNQLKSDIEELNLQVSELSSKLTKFKEAPTEPLEARKSLYDVWEPLISALNTLPANKDSKFSRDNLKQAQDRLFIVKGLLEKIINKISYTENKLEHLNNLKEENCPKCNHRWIPGKSEIDQKRLEDLLKVTREEFNVLEKEKEELEETILSINNYIDTFSTFKHCVNQYPRLHTFWDYAASSGLLRENPLELKNDLKIFQRDLELHCKLNEFNLELSNKTKILETISNTNSNGSIKKRTQELEIEIEKFTEESVKLEKTLNLLTRYFKRLENYIKLTNEFESNVENLNALVTSTIAALRAREINTVIREDQTRLATLQTSISEKQSIEGIIADLHTSEEKLSVEQEAYNLLVKALSPTDGLIAEQLIGFIESFVRHVNEVIERIWTYELRVLPCGLESGDLDYKFPLYVRHEGEDNTSPDISKGSEAQVEMVNLAFKLVIMAYLGLNEYPVFLDETGRSFDEQHRSNAMGFIKSLVDSGNYTQLFFISHYAVQFNAFTNAEVLVLDGTNVTIPKEHNTHVVIN